MEARTGTSFVRMVGIELNVGDCVLEWSSNGCFCMGGITCCTVRVVFANVPIDVELVVRGVPFPPSKSELDSIPS